MAAQFPGLAHGILVAEFQGGLFAGTSVVPAGGRNVDDVFGVQVKGIGVGHIANVQVADLFAGFQELVVSGCIEDQGFGTSTADREGVGGIDDGVCRDSGDVVVNNLELVHNGLLIFFIKLVLLV